MAKTILAIMSNMFAHEDGIISIIAQGGFLDFAANGVVSYVAANGQLVTQKVTPDPSVNGENPNGTPGWLDVLAESIYDTHRISASFASNDLALANTTSNTYGPFAPGTYHVTNPATGAGYSNVNILSIAAADFVGTFITSASNTGPIVITTSTNHGLIGTETVSISGILGNTAANGFWKITVLSATTFQLNGSVGNGAYASGGTVNVCTVDKFQADIAGPDSTSSIKTIIQTVTTLSGVSCSNLFNFIGSVWESNTQLASRCRLKIQSLSPNGPPGAYAYFSLTAAVLLAAQIPAVYLSEPITRVLVQASATTGIITAIIANATGAVTGCSNLAVTGASNASPIVITTTSAHGLSTDDFATVSGVIGNTNANVTGQIIVLSATTFSLNGTSGNAAYAGGGIVEGGDLGQVNTVIQANCVPDGQTAFTTSATEFDVVIVASVDVPQAQVKIYESAVQVALALYMKSLQIGGGSGGVVEYDVIVGVLYAAGSLNGQASYVKRIGSLTLNGGVINLPFPSPVHVAQLSPSPAITVTGV